MRKRDDDLVSNGKTERLISKEMILLDSREYHKVKEPLRQVTINNLFARTVVEKHLQGRIYVDDVNAPTTFYIVHPYGMSLLFGNSDNHAFNCQFREYAMNKDKLRDKCEWMQVFPDSWDDKLKELFGADMVKHSDDSANENCIELNGRVNFKFNHNRYLLFKQNNPSENHFNIVRTDEDTFNNMKGAVVPMYFWKDADHFLRHGMGFSLFCEGKLASTAYSAYAHDNFLEIGVETVDTYRGKGFAQNVCSALIDYCLDNHLEPVWSCRQENIGSCRLAQKLGFEPISIRPYYKLPY